MKTHQLFILISLSSIILLHCSASEEFRVVRQITGGLQTNCYLLYGLRTREAALFDVAGPIDTLLNFIEENELNVRYFFFTHGHFDHIIGLPDIKDRFPEAKVCMHRSDYEDIFISIKWATEHFGQEYIAYLLSDPERKKLHDFDVDSFGEPDIFIEDNQIFKFGNSEIIALHSPGHSPGCVCFYIDTMLFSGDVLFYRSVGRADVLNSSREDQIRSVMRLYENIPEETKVYPGHGRLTDIRSEKKLNKVINFDTITF